jgi:hypothetical protein
MKELENRLTVVLKDITDWLKFAEAKNLALITFNSVWLSYCIKNVFDSNVIDYKWAYRRASLMCIISLIICFIGFIPKISNNKVFYTFIKWIIGKKKKQDNMLFYKHISKYSNEEYYKKFQIDIMGKEEDTYNTNINKYEKALIQQIISLSLIATKKYYLFSASIVITSVPFIGLLIELVKQM